MIIPNFEVFFNCTISKTNLFLKRIVFYNCNFNRAANSDDENVAVKMKPLSRDCIKPMALIAFFGRTRKARFHNLPQQKFLKLVYISENNSTSIIHFSSSLNSKIDKTTSFF